MDAFVVGQALDAGHLLGFTVRAPVVELVATARCFEQAERVLAVRVRVPLRVRQHCPN